MILVTGGTGAVGSKIVKGLIDNQQPVRMYGRGQSDWDYNPMPQFRKQGVDVITGDIRSTDRLAAALQGCTAVIHCAGIMRATPADSLESVNVEPTINLLNMAAAAGVQRFIYLSCLGASQYSTSKYFQTKWAAENAVRSSSFYWTIFRPSFIFDKRSPLIRALEFWCARSPFVWVVGSGLNEVQPVSAEDVAACVVQSIYNRGTVHQTYDLVGPQSYSLTELMQMAGQFVSGEERGCFKIPSSLGYTLGNMMSKLNPRCPISEDVMRVLTAEYLSEHSIMRDNFQVPVIPVESYFKAVSDRKSPKSRRKKADQ